ncbi:hypothetical protein LTR53_001250 [Teratosphaeriaceae sp. CCFEE 6253]|nr:hypothetical protein LTR53_001250 [Teratosphaeriaceae sp. CCFEE 6253]
MANRLHSDHVNYLVLRYLQEHGHQSAAVAFYKDWQRPFHFRDPQGLPFVGAVKRDALVAVVQDGLYFDELCTQQGNTHRRHRWITIDPRAPLGEQDAEDWDRDAEGEEDAAGSEQEAERPPSRALEKRKSTVRPQTMRAPDDFPTPAPKRQRRDEGAEPVHMNGDRDAMGVDNEPSPTADAPHSSSPVSPAPVSDVEVVEVPERYDSMDVSIQTELKEGSKTSTMYWKLDRPGASIFHSLWNPSSLPENASTLLTIGDSLCRFYNVPETMDNVHQISHINDPSLPTSGVVTDATWHPHGHTAACAREIADETGRPQLQQIVLTHGREQGTTTWNADAGMLEPPGVVICMRYSLQGTYLLVLRTNAARGLVQIWRSPSPDDENGAAEGDDKPTKPIAYRWFDRQALDACWFSDDEFLVCGTDGLSCAYQLDTMHTHNLAHPDETRGHGLIERHPELIGFKASWNKLRYDEHLGVAVFASTGSKFLITRPVSGLTHTEVNVLEQANINGELTLPGSLTSLAFQPQSYVIPTSAARTNGAADADGKAAGSLLAATFEEGFCVIYLITRLSPSRAESKKLACLDLKEGTALALAWSPRGTHLAFGGGDVVQIYEAAALAVSPVSAQPVVRKSDARCAPLVVWRPDVGALAAGKVDGGGNGHERAGGDGGPEDAEEVMGQPSLSWSSDGESLGFALDRQIAVIRFRPPLHGVSQNQALANGHVVADLV